MSRKEERREGRGGVRGQREMRDRRAIAYSETAAEGSGVAAAREVR